MTFLQWFVTWVFLSVLVIYVAFLWEIGSEIGDWFLDLILQEGE